MALSRAASSAVEEGVIDRGGGGGGARFWCKRGKKVVIGWKIELRKREVTDPVSPI